VQERYFVGNTSEQYKLISTMLSCSSNASVISDSAAVDSAHFDEEIDSFPYPEKDAPALKSGLVKAAFKLLSTCLLWQKRRAPSLEEASGSAFKDGPLNELRSAIVRLDGRRRSEAADRFNELVRQGVLENMEIPELK
jgi:hypothetical protein